MYLGDKPSRASHYTSSGVPYMLAIAKVMWRVYHKQAALVIELLKKESQDKLLRIFGQEGVLQEWAKKQWITLTFGQLEVFPEKTIKESAEEVAPAKTMGLKLKEL